MEVLTKILQQGTEFDTLAETVLADRFERLVELVTMMGDQGELPIAMALANVVPGSQWVGLLLKILTFQRFSELGVSHRSQAREAPSALLCPQDELARVLVTLFDSRHLLYQLLWNMFSKEVELADSMQTLFRGNSLASKIMTFCFKVAGTAAHRPHPRRHWCPDGLFCCLLPQVYGAAYLQKLLEPLLRGVITTPDHISFEVDPTR